MTLEENDLNNAGAKIQEIHVLYRCKILIQTHIKTSQKVHWAIGYHVACLVMYTTYCKVQRKLKFFS
jgi:hypothetical protein